MTQQPLLQIIISLFVLFAISRVYLRFRERKLSSLSFVFWFAIWILGVFAVFDPAITTEVANLLGIGRGVDAVIYGSIGVIFYLIFRIYVILDDNQKQITQLTRSIALSRTQKKKPARKKR
jgi:small membrane protein